MTDRKYRPSNGSEGDSFYGHFCAKCVRDSEARPCPIFGRSMAHDIDDPKYPREWVYGADGAPTCTAFTDHVKPKPNTIRDKRQIGMALCAAGHRDLPRHSGILRDGRLKECPT